MLIAGYNGIVPLGIYISVPFCRSKCSYCNFASDVAFSRSESGMGASNAVRPVYERYVERVCTDIAAARSTAERTGADCQGAVDSIYIGGGTPTLLQPEQLERIFSVVRANFECAPTAEITAECAPGTLTSEVLDALLGCGVNRISLGVQSFADTEVRAVGRLHTRAAALADIERLRAAGVENLNVDLIAGLPHQTAETWEASLQDVIAAGVPHVSVYLLEIDEDSRLGREVLAGGTRYHAHFVPDEELMAELYRIAGERLNTAGILQYEISNFARPGRESRHNLKYWTRQPYLGFGLDAHTFLPVKLDVSSHRFARIYTDQHGRQETGDAAGDVEALRFATPDSLERYLGGVPGERTLVSLRAAREEYFFLGLRLNRGVDLRTVEQQYGLPPGIQGTITELHAMGLLEH